MKRRKRFLKRKLWVLGLAFSLVLVGCNGSNEDKNLTNTANTSENDVEEEIIENEEINEDDVADTDSEESTNNESEKTSGLPAVIKGLYEHDEYLLEYAEKMIGTEAPDFTLKNINGESVSLSDYKNENIILKLGQTSCHICISTQPVANEFQEKNPEIKVISIFPYDGEQDVEQYVKATNTENVDTVLVGNQTNTIFDDYQVSYTPTFLFIDREGVIQLIHVGSIDEELLELYSELAFD